MSQKARKHLGGQGKPLHLAVANGFPTESYQPFLEPFLGSFEVFATLPRALWTPPPSFRSALGWQQMAKDLLVVLEQGRETEVVGMGHSMGGVATLLAACQQPTRFRAVVLLDPTILSPWLLRVGRWMQRLQLASRIPLVRGALRRKADFASVDEAFAYWRQKRLFHDWSDQVLQLYTEGILTPKADGKGWEMAWSPAWEAHYYKTIYTHSWRALRRFQALPNKPPLLVVRGDTSNTFLEPQAERLQRVVPSATIRVVDDAGHLFPQARPAEAAEVVHHWLAQHLS